MSQTGLAVKMWMRCNIIADIIVLPSPVTSEQTTETKDANHIYPSAVNCGAKQFSDM